MIGGWFWRSRQASCASGHGGGPSSRPGTLLMPTMSEAIEGGIPTPPEETTFPFTNQQTS